MSTMNISLPDALKTFVDEQVSQRGYGTSSEYVRELIRKDQDRQQLRGLLLAGASSLLQAQPMPLISLGCVTASMGALAGEGQAGHSRVSWPTRMSTMSSSITLVRTQSRRLWASSKPWSEPIPTSGAILRQVHHATPTN
jgi:antitoxin ParD1/3/4